MKNLNHPRTLAAGAECARPRAQRHCHGRGHRKFPQPREIPRSLRPRTGALRPLCAVALLLALAITSLAATHYVDINSTNATPPYTNWATAATNIQDAVDAAAAADEIVVTNGTYYTGGRAGSRVNVDKQLNIRSVNGPGFTTISASARGGGLRCVFLTDGAGLSGFTLSGGHSYSTIGGGAFGGTLTNCTLTGNSVDSDQAYGVSAYGGGAAYCTLNNCTVANNSAIADSIGCIGAYGGGAYHCTLNNCSLSGNVVQEGPFHDACYLQGAGAYDCTLNDCTLTGNSFLPDPLGTTLSQGGGAYDCTLNNCTLTSNSANSGGAAYGGTLYNCTLTGNQATHGGGASGGTLNNCIAYFNGYENYDGSGILSYCCTTPQPTSGFGNMTNEPLFLDQASGNLRLQSNSPCINAGNNTFAPAGPDLDGNPRIVGPSVDIGAYEYQSLSLINFSVVSNQTGFNITGQSNQVVIVETSADLVNWSPLATNTLSGHPFSFSDPTPATLPRLFYRAHAQ